jgi:hypothetical protein
MVSSVQAEPARRRRRQASGGLVVWMTERHLAVTFGRVGAGDADRTAALETLFTIWMRTLYSPDPEPSAG